MRRIYFGTFFLLLMTSLCFALERVVIDDSSGQHLSRWIKKSMKQYDIPGVAIVVIKDYKISWTAYYGVTNVLTEHRVSDTTLFQAGSISKPITAIAVLKAVQDNKLRLDDDANDYLTSWTIGESPYLLDEDFVTIRELLSHTGGINVSGFLGYDKDGPIPTLNNVLNGRSPANSPEIKVVQLPGKFTFSGGSYAILEQLLIDVYQRPFPDIMNKLIFQPLSMTRTTFAQRLPPEMIDQIAIPYRPGYFSLKEGPHVYIPEAAAGLWTTPFDLAKVVISLQEALRNDPYQILSPASAKTMMEPELEHMGLGFYVNVDRYGHGVKKGNYFTHSGQTEGYRSMLIASTRDGCGLIIMTNMSDDARLIISGKTKDNWEFIYQLMRRIADMERWR